MHVSSKAHLSSHFKVQVRSHEEEEARQLLAEYDQWYKDNNVSQHLSDRMNAAKTRQSDLRAKTAARGGTYGDRRRSSASSRRASTPPVVVKIEEYDSDYGDADENPWIREQGSTAAAAAAAAAAADGKGGAVDPRLIWRDCSVLSTAIDGVLTRESIGETDVDADTDTDDVDVDDGNARLKGISWPGMNVFDAATPQTRRMRNQRKDGSITGILDKNSRHVEPTELVFSPMGTLRRERDVYDSSIDSPLEGEIVPVPPKRRGDKKTRTASTSSVRSSARLRNKRVLPGGSDQLQRAKPKRKGQRSARERPTNRRQGLRSSGRESTPIDPFSPCDELRSYPSAEPSRRRAGFSVFHDDDNLEWGEENYTMSGRGSSAASFQPRLIPRHDNVSRLGRLHPSAAPSASFSYKKVPAPACWLIGKENVAPILNSRGGIGQPFPRYSFYDNKDSFPFRFHLGSPSFSGDLGSGCAKNPLIMPQQSREDQTLNTGVDGTCDPRSVARVASPNDTISDVGRSDVEVEEG